MQILKLSQKLSAGRSVKVGRLVPFPEQGLFFKKKKKNKKRKKNIKLHLTLTKPKVLVLTPT